MRCVSQTTNLGVRSSNLFGRASNSLILNPNFCAIFTLLTKLELGKHRGNTRTIWYRILDAMPTFLQPVALPERRFLEEVLYWVAFQRLPIIANFDNDGQEIRLSDEMDYAPGIVTELTDEEAERAGIPPDPNWRALIDGKGHLSSAHYDKYLAKEDLDPKLREVWSVGREASVEFEKECALWHPHYERAIEYPCSRIFIALREGQLASKGRLLPALDEDEAADQLDAKGQRILHIPATDISPSFWTLKGIDFESSAAKNTVAHYCHISFLTDDVLRIFPGEREDVQGVERVGETFILSERSGRYRPNSRRGRPPYPWDGFHIEVADLLRRDEMPGKKEAAIEHFQSWFEREHGTRPSRAVVGEKLKPYFDKFIKSARQKS